MLRYMSFVWNPKSDVQQRNATFLIERLRGSPASWTKAFDGEGICVMVNGDFSLTEGCHLLAGGKGVILGTIFHRIESGDSAIAAKPTFGRDESTRAVDSGGRSLITTHWGSYVAFLYERQSARTWILRSPAGHLPCLLTESERIRIIFSSMADGVQLDALNFSINWGFVAKYLLSRHISSANTGFNEVTEIRSGECVAIQAEKASVSAYWDPVHIARNSVVENIDQAKAMLRGATRACVHAWASRHEILAHNLSGGLDSAVVLGCLKDAPTRPRIVCVNHFSDGADSDEREYARAAAKLTGCELIEWRRNSEINMEDTLGAEISERPQGYFRRLELRQLQAEVARQTGATALFNGERGDEMFFKSLPHLAAVDYLLAKGLNLGLYSAVSHAAELENLSIWRVFRTVFYKGLITQQWGTPKQLTQYNTLIGDGVAQALTMEDVYRWTHSGGGVPPGKQFHILGMTNPEDYYYLPLQQGPEPTPVSPLVSQPLMEVCLQIPTYFLTYGGRDRALARQAFADVVPMEILRRRSKGGMEEHLATILKRNVGFIRALLLNGALVQQGILSKPRLEEALSERPSGLLQGFVKVFQYLGIETWLQILSKRCSRIAI